MADLHYIWYGPVPADPAKYDTANRMARLCAEQHRILFWCKRDFADAFRAVLDPAIQVLACDDLDILTNENLGQGMPEWYAEALHVLAALDRARAYSACKDLVSLLVLYSRGGYYMDTTTLIIPDTDPAELNAGFDRTYPSPRVPRISDTGLLHQPFLQTGIAIATGMNYDEPDSMFELPLIDVWAFYSPELHPCTSWMIMSYVSRCNRLGLNDAGVPTNFDAISGTEELANALGRDSLIGQLIIRSVCDGLIEQAFCELNQLGNADPGKQAVSQLVFDYTWPTIELVDAPAQYRLDALHIDKLHAGSWRNQLPQ